MTNKFYGIGVGVGDPEFLEKIKEILRDSERRKEMGRLVVLLEIYGQPDNQDYAE